MTKIYSVFSTSPDEHAPPSNLQNNYYHFYIHKNFSKIFLSFIHSDLLIHFNYLVEFSLIHNISIRFFKKLLFTDIVSKLEQ